MYRDPSLPDAATSVALPWVQPLDPWAESVLAATAAHAQDSAYIGIEHLGLALLDLPLPHDHPVGQALARARPELEWLTDVVSLYGGGGPPQRVTQALAREAAGSGGKATLTELAGYLLSGLAPLLPRLTPLPAALPKADTWTSPSEETVTGPTLDGPPGLALEILVGPEAGRLIVPLQAGETVGRANPDHPPTHALFPGQEPGHRWLARRHLRLWGGRMIEPVAGASGPARTWTVRGGEGRSIDGRFEQRERFAVCFGDVIIAGALLFGVRPPPGVGGRAAAVVGSGPE